MNSNRKDTEAARVDFDALLLRCADKAYHFAFRLTGNDPDAQDLVQAGFARAFEHRDRYDPSRPLGPWVNQILHNVFLDSVRRYEKRHNVSLDAPPPTESDSSWESILPGDDNNPVDDLIRDEEERVLQKALNALPIHYRSAITMADIQEIPYEEIAKIMGVPVGTVCSRIHQGRILLRKALESPYRSFKEKRT